MNLREEMVKKGLLTEEYLRPTTPPGERLGLREEMLKRGLLEAAKPGVMPSPEPRAFTYPGDIKPPRYPRVATTTTPPLLPVAKVAKRVFKPVAIALNVATALEVNGMAKALEVPMEGDWRLHGWGDLFVAVSKQNAQQLEAAKQMGLGMITEAAKKPWYSPQAYAQIASGAKLAEMTTTAMSPAAMYLYGFVLDIFNPADPINWINPARVKSVGKLGRLPAFEAAYNTAKQEWLDKLPAKLANEKLGTVENQMTLFGKAIFTPGGTLDEATKAVNDLMGRDMRTLEKGFDNTLQAAYTLTQAVKKADPAKYEQMLKGVGKELDEMGLRSDTARKWYVTWAYPFTPDEELLLKEGIEEGSKLRKIGQTIAGQRAIKPLEWTGLRRPRSYRLLPEFATVMEYGVGEVGKYGADIAQQAKTVVMQADPEVLTHVKTVRKTVQGKVEKRKVLNDYLDLGIRMQKQLDSGVNLADAVAAEATNNLATSITKKVAKLDKMVAAGKTDIPQDLQAAGMMREIEGEKVERKLPRAQLLVQAEQQIQSAKVVGDTAGVQTITKKWGKFISQYDDALKLFRDKLDRTIRTVDNDRKVILNVADVAPVDKDGNILKSIEDAEGAKWAPTKLLVRNADGSVNYVTEITKIGEYVKALDEGKLTQAQAFRRKWESPVAKAGMEEPTVLPEEAAAGAPPTPPVTPTPTTPGQLPTGAGGAPPTPPPAAAGVTPTPTPTPAPSPAQVTPTPTPTQVKPTVTPTQQVTPTPAVISDLDFVTRHEGTAEMPVPIPLRADLLSSPEVIEAAMKSADAKDFETLITELMNKKQQRGVITVRNFQSKAGISWTEALDRVRNAARQLEPTITPPEAPKVTPEGGLDEQIEAINNELNTIVHQSLEPGGMFNVELTMQQNQLHKEMTKLLRKRATPEYLNPSQFKTPVEKQAMMLFEEIADSFGEEAAESLAAQFHNALEGLPLNMRPSIKQILENKELPEYRILGETSKERLNNVVAWARKRIGGSYIDNRWYREEFLDESVEPQKALGIPPEGVEVGAEEITQRGAIGEAEGVAGAGDWVKDAIDRGLWDNANELKDYAIDVEFDSRKQRPSFREVMEKDITLIRNRITELETGEAERVAAEVTPSAATVIDDVLASIPAEGSIHIDDIVKTTGKTPGEVASALVQLELDKRVRQLPGKKFEKYSVIEPGAEVTAKEPDILEWESRLANAKAGPRTAGNEAAIELYTRYLEADPSKWNVGDGVGWKATKNQINRGFRITEIDATSKTAKISQVADTGLTTTGADTDKIADRWVPIGDLVRDNKYSIIEPAAKGVYKREEDILGVKKDKMGRVIAREEGEIITEAAPRAGRKYVANDGTEFTGKGAKAISEEHNRQLSLVGKYHQSGGGDMWDKILEVRKQPNGRYEYTVQDIITGVKRTHGTPIKKATEELPEYMIARAHPSVDISISPKPEVTAPHAIDPKTSPIFETLPASVKKRFDSGSMGIEPAGEKYKVWGLTQKGTKKYLPAEFDSVDEAVELSQVSTKSVSDVIANMKAAKTLDELTTAYRKEVAAGPGLPQVSVVGLSKHEDLLEDVYRRQLAKIADSDKSAEIELTRRAGYDDKAKELLADIIKNRATALPAIGSAPLAFEQDNEDEGGMSLWEKALLYSFFGGALVTGGLAGYKYLKSRGLQITKAGIKAIDAAEVASRIAEQTRTEIMRLGEAREELLRLDRQAELLREHGQGIARPFYVGDPAVKATENTFWNRLGIDAEARVKFKQAFTQAIPQEFQTAYQDIMYRARWLGVHADRVSRQLFKDIDLLAETEKIGKKELADALTQEAARNMISYDKNELAAIRKLYEGKLIPYRQIRHDVVGRQMQALQENFGRFVNVDEVNKQVEELNKTLSPDEQLAPIVVTAGEPLTTDQLKTAAEVANYGLKQALANVADLFQTGIEELPIVKNLSPQGRASALNIAAQLSSLYEFTRAMDDIKRKPFGFLTDWLDEERLTYAYHTMTKEARDRYWKLHEGQELPYIGGVVVRTHPIVNAHDTIRKLFPSYSIHEINRLGRASTDTNITDLADYLAKTVNDPTAPLPLDNALGRLAEDMGVSGDTILQSAVAFTHTFGSPLRQTLVDDPSWLVGVRMSATKSIARTGDLIRDTMKFGLPKSLVAPKGVSTGAYQSWAPLSITEKIEDPILSKMFANMYFPPEIKQMVDRALTNYHSPFKQFRRPDQQRGLAWSTWNVIDHSLNLMKTQALGTLGYVHMNLISALWQNWMEDVSPDAYVAMIRYGTTKQMPEGVKYSAREFDEGLSAVAMSGFINSELRKPTALSSKFTKTVYKAFAEDIAIGQPLPPGATNWLSQGTETYVRGAHMMDKLQKGYSLNDAIRSALHAQYDYATDTYGDLFQYSFKVFPFLKWQINNIPYTFVKLFTQPRKVRFEVFNVPKLGWQMLEPTLPEEINTDLQYSPKYRVDRMPIPIATYTTETGRRHAVMWGLARQFPHLEPLALAPNIYTNEWRKDVETWLWEEQLPEMGLEVLGQARPEIGIIYSAITAIGGGPAREVTGRPITLTKRDPTLRLLENIALRVIPVQRLFRIMEVGGLELKHLRPKVVPTTYDALRKNPDMSKIGLLLGSGNLYVYDATKERQVAAMLPLREREQMMSELYDMMVRGESPEDIKEESIEWDKRIKQFYKELNREAAQNFADVQTKGGK